MIPLGINFSVFLFSLRFLPLPRSLFFFGRVQPFKRGAVSWVVSIAYCYLFVCFVGYCYLFLFHWSINILALLSSSLSSSSSSSTSTLVLCCAVFAIYFDTQLSVHLRETKMTKRQEMFHRLRMGYFVLLTWPDVISVPILLLLLIVPENVASF